VYSEVHHVKVIKVLYFSESVVKSSKYDQFVLPHCLLKNSPLVDEEEVPFYVQNVQKDLLSHLLVLPNSNSPHSVAICPCSDKTDSEKVK
jgi:hypothetical protein